MLKNVKQENKKRKAFINQTKPNREERRNHICCKESKSTKRKKLKSKKNPKTIEAKGNLEAGRDHDPG